jgi:hypothetical protein
MTKLEMGFAPLREGKYFWSLDKAWGVFEEAGSVLLLKVLYGAQILRRFAVSGSVPVRRVSLMGNSVPFSTEKAAGKTVVVLNADAKIEAGETLIIEIEREKK